MVVALGTLRLVRSLQRGVRPVFPLLLLVGYTIIGAFIFKAIEQPHEIEHLAQLKTYREDQLEDIVFALNRAQHREPEKAFNLSLRILRRYERRLGLIDPEHVQPQWDIWGATHFVFTVYTTIGYGTIYPVTDAGRFLTILFAFIGIPLALIALIALGSFLARLCKRLWSLVLSATRCFSANDEKPVDGVASKEKEDDMLSFPVSLLILLTVAWVFLCSWLFTEMEEDWDYTTSLYFAMISFTTIGFGDIVPKNPKYMIPIGVLLLIGLALVSTVLSVIQQQIEALSQGVEEKINMDCQETTMVAEQEANGDESDEAKKLLTPQTQKAKKMSLSTVVGGMSLRKQMLFKIMPDSSKQTLKAYCKKKATMTTAACQTDPIPRKITCPNSTITRSNDDVNDLLLMSFWD